MARKHYPQWVLGLGSGLAAGSFAVFFGGTLVDGVAAVVTGIAITIMLNILGKIERNQLAKTFIVSFIAGIFILLMIRMGFGNNADKIMIGSIMLLIPGIAMTNSVRDMLIGDIVSGMLRLTNSLIQAAAIACGFALAIMVMGGVAI